jgi:aminopeptidase N
VAQRLGWDARPDETPAVQELRRLLIRDLGVWGDPQILEGARSRFAAFVEDHGAISPDDQPGILSIVAMYADAATFAQLHDIAKAARDETEQQRFFLALMDVGDPALAVQAAAIALSPEIPTQGARWRMRLVVRLANLHPELAWRTFKDNAQMLLAPNPKYAPLIMAESVPVLFWDCVPLDELEAFVRQSLPEEMAPNIARGMEAARFNVAEKERIVPAIGAYRPTAQN